MEDCICVLYSNYWFWWAGLVRFHGTHYCKTRSCRMRIERRRTTLPFVEGGGACLPSPPADSAGLDRQKMLSFAPCGTIRANSIKIPSKEERWNCVMVVGELNLVMILSRGKWSRSANIMINSLQSTRFSFLHPLAISFPSTHMHILLP